MTEPGPGGAGGDTLILDAETWPSLLPEDDAAQLSDIDQGIIFDALVEFAERGEVDFLEVETEARDTVSADEALLIPGTRIHVRAGEAGRDAVKRLVKMAAIFAILGAVNPAVGFVGLSVDLAVDLFDRASRLDDVDLEIVRAVLRADGSDDSGLSTEEGLARSLPDVDRLGERLRSLEKRGVLVDDDGAWRAVF